MDFQMLKNPCQKISCSPGSKEIWLLNSPELNPLDYYVWGNGRGLSRALSKLKIIAELKEMLPNLGPIDRAIKEFQSDWRLVL